MKLLLRPRLFILKKCVFVVLAFTELYQNRFINGGDKNDLARIRQSRSHGVFVPNSNPYIVMLITYIKLNEENIFINY